MRLWAKRRGMFSSMAGYLGGVSWACLVAYVCQQQRPTTHPAEALLEVFEVYASWSWKSRPVDLSDVRVCVRVACVAA